MEKEKKAYIDLGIWKESRALTNDIYVATKSFPKEEVYGLVGQMRRCAISVPSNIAEGCVRNYPKDSIQFFFISSGPIYELETQLYISFEQSKIRNYKKIIKRVHKIILPAIG